MDNVKEIENTKTSSNMIYPKWGDIYLADLGSPNGHIQGGVRPIMIISNNINNQRSPVINFVAMTSKKEDARLPVHIRFKSGDVAGLTLDTSVTAEQNGTLNKEKLIKPLGRFNKEQMKEIAKRYILQHPFLQYIIDDKEFISSALFQKIAN